MDKAPSPPLLQATSLGSPDMCHSGSLCHGSKESKERRLVAKAEGTACKRPRGVLDPGDSLRVEQCLWDRGGEDRERNCPASGSMLCPLPQLCPAVVG